MHAVDTNVLVRLFVLDNPTQVAAARQATSSTTIFVPKSVIVELEWVLRRSYSQSRATIVAVLEVLLDAVNFRIEDSAAVMTALEWFRHGMDLADALHLASSAHSEAFLTFDVAMQRRASTIGTMPTVIAP
ncbi:MAG: type II toxin-antitoxin system VapC family toxin [Enhydrobacter sp.]|nr:type II toxin-antitoxin system VapC family toxin [Enhydrobacter sp.]